MNYIKNMYYHPRVYLVQHHPVIFSREFFYPSGSVFHYGDGKQQAQLPKNLKDKRFCYKTIVKRLTHIKEPTMNPLDPELLEAVCMN